MANRRRKASGRFALGMIIYALAFVVFLSIGLRIFWGYIDGFEKSQPNHAIDRYIDSFDSAHIRALSADFVSSHVLKQGHPPNCKGIQISCHS